MKPRLKDTLLLISNSKKARTALRSIFESNYYLLEAESAEKGVFLLNHNYPCIAAVISHVPETQKEVLQLIQASRLEEESEIPVLFMVSGKKSEFQEEQLLLWGAADVLLQDSAVTSIQRRVQILVDLYHQRLHLEQQVQSQNQIIRNTYQTMLDTLAAIIEHRNTGSGNHSLRIRGLTSILLRQVAQLCPEYGLNEEQIELISSAAALHDIGKISVPDSILNKPGRLTDEEYELVKAHTTIGGEIVARLQKPGNNLYLQYAYNIALYHHERWDGSGYPNGISGDDIPICAQAAGLIDAFDALTTPRSYKDAFPFDVAVTMICNGECGAFSPRLLECFKIVCPELIQFSKKHSDFETENAEDFPIPADIILDQPLNALQLSQLKYQGLLHYLDDTVMELDIDNGIYHVVYNPNPNFIALFENATMDTLADRMLQYGVHPKDITDKKQLQQLFSQQLFQEKRHKVTFLCDIYNPLSDSNIPHEVSLLRVNTEKHNQRHVLAVFHQLTQQTPSREDDKKRMDLSTLYGILSGVLCCAKDGSFSILKGAPTLLPLTGYTPAEIHALFGDSLLQMLTASSRPLLQDIFGVDKPIEFEEMQLQLCHKTKGSIWVQCKGKLAFDDQGIARYYFTLSDITQVRKKIDLLERDLSRNQIVVDQFRNAILEWDLTTGELYMSRQWKERFGYDMPSAYAEWVSVFGANVHPDDLAELSRKTAQLKETECKESVDLRIADSQGRYLWSRVRAVSQCKNSAKPTSIIAVIYNIHDLKEKVLSMEQKMQQDALTKLMNKDSTQTSINRYLETMEPDTYAAMLSLDVDNFKAINDTFGHLYGDAVLTRISGQLRSLFRSWDIIGRMGGDEFAILLKDLPNETVATDRCEMLVNHFREYLQDLMPGLDVSISVGCALIPKHGKTFDDLYERADTALYTAKRKGKCQFSIYDAADAFEQMPFPSTRIESDEEPVTNDEGFMRFAFQSLYTSQDIEKTIQSLLAHIGTRFNVSRVYVFENNDANTHCNNTFEWCNVGIHPEIENLQNVSYETDAPNWPSYFNAQGVMYCSDISQLPDDVRQILEPQGIKSMLHCAIMDNGVFRGYVGFDDCHRDYMWTQEQITLLEYFAQILSVFLLQHRKKNK